MQKKKTTKELLSESIQELAQAKEVDRITIREIVENCGLTSTTFYHHFTDKYELILWVYTSFAHNLAKKLVHPEYTLKLFLYDNLEYLYQKRSFIRNAVYHTFDQDSFVRHSVRQISVAVDAPLKERWGIDEIPFEIYCYIEMYAMSCLLMFVEWLDEGMPTELATLQDLLWRGIPQPLKAYIDNPSRSSL